MTYTAGVAGFGRVGRNHAEAFLETDGVELAALAELDAELLAELGDRWGVPEAHRYREHADLLASEDLDAISVATPQEFHRDHVLDVAESADPPDVIWCEKPIATTVADADEMVEACETAGIELVLNHNRRFTRAHRRLRRELEGGLIGTVGTVHQVAGMSLLGSGTHFVDLLLFLLDGDPTAVRGGTTVEMDGGPTVVVDMVDDPGLKRASLRTYLFGTEGGIEFPLGGAGVNPLPWRYWRVEDGAQVETTPPAPFGELWEEDTSGTHSTYDPSMVGHQRSFELAAEHLVELLDGTATNHSPGANAVRGLEILAGMAVSGDTGGEVSLPLSERFREAPIETDDQ